MSFLHSPIIIPPFFFVFLYSFIFLGSSVRTKAIRFLWDSCVEFHLNPLITRFIHIDIGGIEEQRNSWKKGGGDFSLWPFLFFSQFSVSDIWLSFALNIFAACSDATLIPPTSGIIHMARIFSVLPLSWQAKGSTKCTEVLFCNLGKARDSIDLI